MEEKKYGDECKHFEVCWKENMKGDTMVNDCLRCEKAKKYIRKE